MTEMNRAFTPDANPSLLGDLRFLAAGPEDVLAFVPVALGFVPDNSLVLLTWGETRFQARVDLPDDPELLEAAVATLTRPCQRHEVSEAMIIVYADRHRAEACVQPVVEGFALAEVDLVDLFGADGATWFPLGPDCAHVPAERYDLTSHPFTARAVLEGRVLLPSRDDLAASLSVDELGRARTASLLRELAMPHCAESWLSAHLTLLSADPAAASGELLARALWCLQDTYARELVWGALHRDNAARMLPLFVRLLKVAPDAYAAHPAALVAFAAWLTGNGALAWCAVDRCLEISPEHLMATGLAVLLERGTPPRAWDDLGSGPVGVRLRGCEGSDTGD